jgi:integrase
MRVFKRPRSPYYYFDFDLGGTTHVKSTRLKSERQALDYAAAYRLKLIKRQVGIIEEEKPRVPTFQEFQSQFDAWIDAQHAGKPGTIKFYKSNYQKLLEFEPMRDLALDRIDEAVIERLKFWALRKVGRTTVNRYLATLRKALRYAWRKLKVIDKAPVIEQYQNERQVEYVFDEASYQLWLDNAEEPLRSASILARNSGITRVEMLNLERDCVIIRKDPDEDGNWGDLIIKRGLKRRARKRVLKINQESKSVLENLISQSKCRYVFSQPRHPDQKLQPWVLESEMGRLREKLARDKIKLDLDAGLHTLRHTFLTEAGRAHGRLYAAVHRRARHHQDHDALCPPSGGVGQPGVRADQSEKEASGVGVADRSDRMKAVEKVRPAYGANSAYKNAYTENSESLKL